MIQNWVHRIVVGGGVRYVRAGLILFIGTALIAGYNWRGFKDMSNAEAMDTAQLARNIADHKGYTTLFVRPFSLFLVQRADAERNGIPPVGDTRDHSLIRDMHPDLANPPVYPLLLAGVMKVDPKMKYQAAGSQRLWNHDGKFWIYEPDFLIGLLNEAIFFAGVVVVFFLSRRLFDRAVAWTSAGAFLGTDLFWRFSMSGLSTMLLILIFLGLTWGVVNLEKAAREKQRSENFLMLLAAVIGFALGVGCLTRYSFGWLVIPVLVFLMLFAGQSRVILCLTVVAVFAVAVTPWMARNYRISRTPFGVAGYAMYETTTDFPEDRLQRALEPDLSRINYVHVWNKFATNLQTSLQEDLPKLGGSWISAFFLVGLLIPYKNPGLRRLRYFLLLCLVVLLVVQSFGKTTLSEDCPVINSENLLVLTAPVVIIFGVSLFYILADQLVLPAPQFRYLIIGGFGVAICLPAVVNFITPRTTAISWPPYLPPAIQRSANYMKPNELMMSDVPWAVAWYGRRQCIWLTLNAQADFFNVYDYHKPVKAIYLTPVTMDKRFLSQWVRADEHSWGSFALESMLKHELPLYFPLRRAPAGYLPDQLFITDIDRWSRPAAAATIPSQ
jgi:hypothetical protein